MIELISIHVPKTGGSSFLEVLKQAYGEDGVLKVISNHREDKGLPMEAPKIGNPPVLPPKTKVLHGHFLHNDFINHYGLSKNIPVVTWVRDPVERLIGFMMISA